MLFLVNFRVCWIFSATYKSLDSVYLNDLNKIVWPNELIYYGQGCMGTPIKIPLPQASCESIAGNYYYYSSGAATSFDSYSWSQVTIGPSSSGSTSSSLSTGGVFGIVAACLLVLLGAFVLIYNFLFNAKAPSLAQQQRTNDVELR